MSNELGVRKGIAVSSIDDENGVATGGGGGVVRAVEEGEGILREGKRLRRWRERDVWSETVESFRLRRETGVWIYRRTAVIGCCFRHVNFLLFQVNMICSEL